MAKLKLFGDHSFSTQGIVVQKGSKKSTLEGKKAIDYLKDFDINTIGLYIFTSKKNEDSMYNEFTFLKNTGTINSILETKWNLEKNVFEVIIFGEFEKELDETEVKMLFDNGQTVEDIGFSIRGLMGGDIWDKGFISRIDRFDAKENDSFFPKIRFEFTP